MVLRARDLSLENTIRATVSHEWMMCVTPLRSDNRTYGAPLNEGTCRHRTVGTSPRCADDEIHLQTGRFAGRSRYRCYTGADHCAVDICVGRTWD